jgi:hypothetical protein
MAARLNERAYQYAWSLIAERRCVVDARDDWSEHLPSARAEATGPERPAGPAATSGRLR